MKQYNYCTITVKTTYSGLWPYKHKDGDYVLFTFWLYFITKMYYKGRLCLVKTSSDPSN